MSHHFIRGVAGENESLVVDFGLDSILVPILVVDDPEMPAVFDACLPAPSWYELHPMPSHTAGNP